MNTNTPVKNDQYKEFFELYAKDIAQYIINCGYDLTAESICKIGNIDANKGFMDFPDYDPDEPIETADSLVVLYFGYVNDEIEFNKLYEFFEQNLSYCLQKINEV